MVPVKSFMVPAEKFVSVDRDTDSRTAAALMRDKNIGSLFVTRNNEVVGIITDTDFVAVAINLLETIEETEPVTEDYDDEVVA